MRGGPSHLDMWDPKPDAPAEYRGEFGIQPSKVPGILLSDLLPMSGRIMEKWSIVRSLHHHDAGHSSGDQICFTGCLAGPNIAAGRAGHAVSASRHRYRAAVSQQYGPTHFGVAQR